MRGAPDTHPEHETGFDLWLLLGLMAGALVAVRTLSARRGGLRPASAAANRSDGDVGGPPPEGELAAALEPGPGVNSARAIPVGWSLSALAALVAAIVWACAYYYLLGFYEVFHLDPDQLGLDRGIVMARIAAIGVLMASAVMILVALIYGAVEAISALEGSDQSAQRRSGRRGNISWRQGWVRIVTAVLALAAFGAFVWAPFRAYDWGLRDAEGVTQHRTDSTFRETFEERILGARVELVQLFWTGPGVCCTNW